MGYFNTSIFYDDLSNVISEAFSNGMPVIATDVGGINEQIENGVNGRLVQPLDMNELSAAIEQIVGNKNPRMALGANARKTHSERFGVDRSLASYAEVYGLSKTEPAATAAN